MTALSKIQETVLQGLALSHGIAIGTLRFEEPTTFPVQQRALSSSDVACEQQHYQHALSSTRNDLEKMRDDFVVKGLHEAAAILDTHREILDDPLIVEEIPKQIAEMRCNAEYAFQYCVAIYLQKFEELKDPFFRERGGDLRDISQRIQRYLRKLSATKQRCSEEKIILYAREITATDVAEASTESVLAFVSEVGGATSHAAIIAKAKGVPYIANVPFVSVEGAFETRIVVDGRTGQLVLAPEEKTLDRYRFLQAQLQSIYEDLQKHGCLESETRDGYHVKLSANLEMVSEVEQLKTYNECGVGLFRSEYLFLSKRSFPFEEEQYKLYKHVVERLEGRPIVIRAFDVGGDKFITEFEGGDFLGCRAIRFLLKEKKIFKEQLRAIMRASSFGTVSILLPMISDVSELMEAKELIHEVEEELWQTDARERRLRLGCMVEVPSAALMADRLARECDFLAIGTNDLVQYLLAVDRCHQSRSKFFTPMHPALIRMIKLIVTQASEQGVPVSLCGEIAGDPRFTALLLGLGVSELSVALRNYPVIKKTIRHCSIIRAGELANEALKLSTSDELKELLNREYSATMPKELLDLIHS